MNIDTKFARCGAQSKISRTMADASVIITVQNKSTVNRNERMNKREKSNQFATFKFAMCVPPQPTSSSERTYFVALIFPTVFY